MITVGMSSPYPILGGGAPVRHLATIPSSEVQVSVIPGRWGSEEYIWDRRLFGWHNVVSMILVAFI